MSRLSRRTLLGFGALAGVGGVIGTAPVAAAAAPRTPLALDGRGMRRLAGSARSAVGDSHAVRGDLVDVTTGLAAGEVHHTGHVVARRGTGRADEIATVEQHLFVTPHGTLAGSGTVTHAGRGTFVVVGGTGRYAGATGSYTTEQTADSAGGGTARYRFDLTTAN